MELKRTLAFLLLMALLVTLMPAPQVHAQTQPPAEVTRLLESLTPEERVGQLFLVTFTGTDTNAESQIYDLINNYHVGGVILQSGNDNFTAETSIIQDTHQLIANLQNIEWDGATAPLPNPDTGEILEHAYVPLFIGIEQEGDGYPTDQILSGVTSMPSAMSLGATWRPELAQQIGEIQGKELSALGFNLYLGPSMDVLDTPNPAARSDISTHAFGGDPYWVGEMGSAFISGLHTGSDGRMLVIAKHFPGPPRRRAARPGHVRQRDVQADGHLGAGRVPHHLPPDALLLPEGASRARAHDRR